MDAVNVGVIGCGNISGTYIKNLGGFKATRVIACADLDPKRAAAKAAEFGVPRACSTEELIADRDVDVVLNLTIPQAHAGVSRAALAAGKHIYSEKPLATAREDGRLVLDAARAHGRRVGCAPDTFLGGGLQTCRRVIDDGAIGEPVAAVAFMLSHGMESWHPDPEFFYKPGGGPMFDMGPYYLTALIHLLGPVRRVGASVRASFPERVVTSSPNHGKRILVETPTHVTGVMDFVSGAVATIVTSFDVWAHHLPRIEVYGSEGSLSVPDPNTFDGPVRVRGADADTWTSIPLSHGYTDNFRGLGLADMAAAIASGRPHRASGELAYHVLEVMSAFKESSDSGRHVEVSSTCSRPTPLPIGLEAGEVDA